MGMDTNRVYFYTFFLLVLGCWLLYNKWFAGIGFITLSAFSPYFNEFLLLHNYFASVTIYVGIIQGLAFYTGCLGKYTVGIMEFSALCVGTVFTIKTIE